MTWTMIRHEWKLIRRAPVAWWAMGLLVAAVAYAVAGGLAWRDGQAAETLETRQEAATLLAAQREAASGEDAPAGAVVAAKTFAALPPGPLASFTVGLHDLLPHRAEISIWKRPDTMFGRYQLESPLSLLVGRFDLVFVVLYLLPLFILALSYDMLAREREGGRLALVLMQPVSLPRLLAAKVLARLLPLTVLLALAIAVAALAAGTPTDAWPRLAGWFGIAWLYGVFWLALCALIAAFAHRGETCAATLAGLWLLLVLVLPGLLDFALQTASPVPSRLAYVSVMREASSTASKQSAELLAQYYHEHPELAANGQQGGFLPAYYASERDVERRLEPLVKDFEGRLGRQQDLVARWRFASPAVLAQEALLEISGSSLTRHRSFVGQARTFLAGWHAELAPLIFLGKGLEPTDYDRLPQFSFAEPPVSRSRFAGAALGLTFPSFLALALAWRWLSGSMVAP